MCGFHASPRNIRMCPRHRPLLVLVTSRERHGAEESVVEPGRDPCEQAGLSPEASGVGPRGRRSAPVYSTEASIMLRRRRCTRTVRKSQVGRRYFCIMCRAADSGAGLETSGPFRAALLSTFLARRARSCQRLLSCIRQRISPAHSPS